MDDFTIRDQITGVINKLFVYPDYQQLGKIQEMGIFHGNQFNVYHSFNKGCK